MSKRFGLLALLGCGVALGQAQQSTPAPASAPQSVHISDADKNELLEAESKVKDAQMAFMQAAQPCQSDPAVVTAKKSFDAAQQAFAQVVQATQTKNGCVFQPGNNDRYNCVVLPKNAAAAGQKR